MGSWDVLQPINSWDNSIPVFSVNVITRLGWKNENTLVVYPYVYSISKTARIFMHFHA